MSLALQENSLNEICGGPRFLYRQFTMCTAAMGNINDGHRKYTTKVGHISRGDWKYEWWKLKTCTHRNSERQK